MSDYYVQILCVLGINAIMALGLNLITGIAGQLSLGHAAFMSIGAYASALCTLNLGMPFGVSLAAGTCTAAFFGWLIGYPILRLKGDYLAISTMGFAEITRVVLLNMPIVGGALGLSGIPPKTTVWVVLALLAVVIVVLARLQSSRSGRAWLAIREDDIAAEAMGIELPRWKILAFTIGAGLAGLGGGLYAHMLTYINPSDFSFMKSIEMLNMVVLGGMGSIPGTLIGSTLLSTAPEFLRFMRNYRMMFYGLLLVFMMIFRPDGVWGRNTRRRLRFEAMWLRMRQKGTPGTTVKASNAPPLPKRALANRSSNAEPLLVLNGVSVVFGGLTALNNINLKVGRGEILGLIGPNGAGKTTLFNVVSGVYKPTSGSVTMKGRDISAMPAHEMAGLGLSRTFQNIRLFHGLTVLENVRIAFHSRTRSGPLGSVLGLPANRWEEEGIDTEAMALLGFVGLGEKADEEANSLPYGEQRRLEIARALATDPELLLLDEPAAGMNPQETTELMSVIRSIRDQGVTVLLVEHDMHLVQGICDRVTVLDYGKSIAEGIPEKVITDPQVIAAYLG